MIEDAFGGSNIHNCNETCLQEADFTSLKNSSNDNLSAETSTTLEARKTKKYAFDVVSFLDHENNLEAGNNSYDESNHKRIVRVSLQKPIRKNQGACFHGNESYALYDDEKLIKPTKRHQINLNIRFKTLSANGLLFLMYQKFSNEHENFVSLSIEDRCVRN